MNRALLTSLALLVASPAAAQPEDAAPAPRHAPGDPLENLNRRFFGLNQTLDRAIIRPAALGYRQIVPKVLRSGIRNVFVNLTEPIVFLNDVLQLRPKNAVRTFKRFFINTTLGVGGLIDVARHEKLPHRGNGFGNTLGRYGVKTGPYVYLPILGPSDLRDLGGGVADGAVLTTAVGSPFTRTDYQVGRAVVTGLDARAELDGDLKALLDGALDPYATLRSVYLQNRAAEVAAVKRGTDPDSTADPAPAELADPLLDPAAAPPASDQPAADQPASDAAPTEPPAVDTPAVEPPATEPPAPKP